MEIMGSVALVTGANRGIGRAFAYALLAHGAAKVYAGVRTPEDFHEPGMEPLRLDVTDPDQIAAAAVAASDATIVINNAGIEAGPGLLEGSLDGARQEMEVNYLGTWAVSRAFAPVLAANGGGALVNMLSVASWRTNNRFPGYAASKAAQWSITNALRLGLREQGTLVIGVHVGFVDTDFTAGIDAPKTEAVEVAARTMDAISRDEPEVLVDDVTGECAPPSPAPSNSSTPQSECKHRDRGLIRFQDISDQGAEKPLPAPVERCRCPHGTTPSATPRVVDLVILARALAADSVLALT